MSFNLGKSLSRKEMKNVKGGNWIHGCAPNGSTQPYRYALGCCELMCHEFGVGEICYANGAQKPCLEIMT